MNTTTPAHAHAQHRRRHSRHSSGGAPPDANAHVDLSVHFLDNSVATFHVPLHEKESELTARICQKLGFASQPEAYFFGLVESTTGQTLDRPLAKTEEVGELVWRWQQEGAPSKLVFGVKLFFDTVLRSPSPVVLHYRYIQAVHHVVTGLYPVPPAVAVRLACLQFTIKFGGVCGTLRPDTFLGNRVVEFIAGPLLRTRKPSEWSAAMQALFAQDSTLGRLGEDAARREYLRIVERHPFYGSTLFRVVRDPQTAAARDAWLAVNPRGVQVFAVPSSSPLLDGPTHDASDDVQHAVAGPELAYTLQEMLRWGYVPSSLFYVSLKNNNSDEDQQQQECTNFGTPHGSWICDCVSAHAWGFLTEQEHLEAAQQHEESAASEPQP